MNYLSLLLVSLLIFSCKQQQREPVPTIAEEATENVVARTYPENLKMVFESHGGLELWNKQHTLQYDIPKLNNTERHTIDLKSRKDKVASEKFTMGFDGQRLWLLDSDKNYTGNVEFYHNLMFYFYAMPFVLADDGIIYEETEDLVFEGIRYPGIKISYNSGVGTSPKDDYFIHYNTETNRMAWLGYTVTYRSGEKSDNVRWIRYDDWSAINGLLLPRSITWHNYEGREIKDARNTVGFENISISETPLPAAFYEKPEQAVYWEKEETQ